MAKGNKKTHQAPKQVNQPTSADKAKQLLEQQQQKINVAIDNDERIQKRLAELNEYSELLKEEQKAIHNEYEQLKLKLSEDINNQMKAIEEEKLNLLVEQRKIEEDRLKMIAAIQSQEKKIQESYRIELHAQWDAEIQGMILQHEKLVAASKEEYEKTLVQKELILREVNEYKLLAIEESHKIRMVAEQEKLLLLQQAQQKNEQDYKQLVEEYEQKMLELSNKENVLKRQKLEIDLQQEDLVFIKEELAEKRKYLEAKMSELSPQRVEQLQYEKKSLEEFREVDRQIIEQLKAEIHNLEKLLPEDELRSVSTIVQELETARRENRMLRNELAQYPSMDELVLLRNHADTVEILQNKVAEATKLKLEAENRAENLHLGVIELEQSKRVAETLKTLNMQLQEELNKINEVYKQNTQSRFAGLLEIDQQIKKKEVNRATKTNLTLGELVKYLQNYGASHLKLYYSEKTIRTFIASLAASRLIILQGLSGTGKSSLSILLEKALQFNNVSIPVQPSWRDNRELLGYDNDFTRRFKETEFTKKVYEASAPSQREKIYLIVLDEMNLARIEYYFADFLSVLEKDPEEWKVSLVSVNDELNPQNRPAYLVNNGTSLMVTPNTWFIGTANRDESTFGITDKVYDRAQVLDFSHREEAFQAQPVRQISLSFSEFNSLLIMAQDDKKNCLQAEDWNKINLIDEFLRSNLEITFGNRVEMQLEKFVAVYVAAGGKKLDAIDHILAHKVLRKLEGRYETYLRESLKELLELIDMEFGKGQLSESRSLIERKIVRLGG